MGCGVGFGVGLGVGCGVGGMNVFCGRGVCVVDCWVLWPVWVVVVVCVAWVLWEVWVAVCVDCAFAVAWPPCDVPALWDCVD